ncbi:MAG: entericidin A/B family lipoprotein [Proteobacteria bacterium]|nr:entericidin A/B family lipoprotein [Pseudomonadota bacterium]
MRVVMVLMALAIAGVSLAACETVKGVGKDIENTGEAMDRTF